MQLRMQPDWLIQTSHNQRTLVRAGPVKALLNTRDISDETHLEMGFVMYERDSLFF